MVPELANMSYQERLKELKLPTLVYRRHRADMIQTYKILHNEYDLDKTVFFKPPADARTRGHPHKIFKERVVTSTRSNFFTSRVVELWNELPVDVVTAANIDSFKENLDRFWSSKDWLYDFESET